MVRKIIGINRGKCNGCGLCVNACYEGAIGLEGGKEKLLRDDYCDGLGNCLPVCPAGTITFVEREAALCNEKEAKKNNSSPAQSVPSRLDQWPVQIKLVPVNAPYFENAALLIAAGCTAYAYANFHESFMCGTITLIGCPKLDHQGGGAQDYMEKLAAILTTNSIKSLTVVRMEVPCCAGIVASASSALKESGKMIPWITAVRKIRRKNKKSLYF